MNEQDNKASKDSQGTASGLIEEERDFVIESFKHGLNFAERLSKTAATLPWTLLESLGVTEEKTRGPKDFNLKLVDSVFRLTNKMAARALAMVEAPTQWQGNKTPKPETTPPGKTAASRNTRETQATAAQRKVKNR